MPNPSSYIQNLKKRRIETSLRSNVVFGQTLGWVFTILGAFRYFICKEELWWFGLMLGNALLILGVGLPQALELPQKIIEIIAETISTQLQKIVLFFVYIVVVCPALGLVKRSTAVHHSIIGLAA